jgi:multiple sugar transport system ATP-binding protein
MAELVVTGLTRSYGNVRAVDDISFRVADGELVTLLGPSGCGKSTTLFAIAGLDRATTGQIRVGSNVFFDSAAGIHLPPERRNCGLVFQSYALWPHMSVRENVSFPLKLRKVAAAKAREKADWALSLVEMERYGERYPHELSGGQQQRVALARTLVYEPQVLLLDEPLSNLDAKLRVEMRAEIARLQRDLSVTTIFVTHDQVEAMTLGDRVVVLRDGLLQQFDRPQRLYDRPANLFVAEFIGSPSMNLVEAGLERQNGGMVASFGEHRLTLDRQAFEKRPDLWGYNGRRVILGIRPEDLEDFEFAHDADSRIAASVDIREDMGSEVFVHFAIGAPPVVQADVAAAVGEDAMEATAEQARRRGGVFVARIDRESLAGEGEPIQLAVDTRRLHFFDAESGRGIYGD